MEPTGTKPSSRDVINFFQVLLRQPQNSGGAITNALGGLGLDYETFALLLALAGLAGAYTLYQVSVG